MHRRRGPARPRAAGSLGWCPVSRLAHAQPNACKAGNAGRLLTVARRSLLGRGADPRLLHHPLLLALGHDGPITSKSRSITNRACHWGVVRHGLARIRSLRIPGGPVSGRRLLLLLLLLRLLLVWSLSVGVRRITNLR